MGISTYIKGNTLLENTTTVAAVGAVVSPVWLPWLSTASEVAATIAPVLGGIWLIVQIISKSLEAYQKWNDREDR